MGFLSKRFNCSKFLVYFSVLGFLSSVAFGAVPPSSQAQKFCREILLNTKHRFKFSDVPGSPGLKVLKHPNMSSEKMHSHELDSAAKYARILKEENQSLVLIPTLNARDVPGFDGLILDQKGEPVLNFSLKTVLETGSSKIVRDMTHHLTRKGIEKAKKFSSLTSWLETPGLFDVDDDDHQWLSKALKLFGIDGDGPPKRKTRIVVDVLDHDFDLNSRDMMKVRTLVQRSSDYVESVVFLHRNRSISVR